MTNLKPEERAREWIDRKLEDAGWKVINRDEYAPCMTAVAVREVAMCGGLEADYLLLIDGKAAAVRLSLKRQGDRLQGLPQAEREVRNHHEIPASVGFSSAPSSRRV